MPYYFAEVTDTYGGNANYIWVRRYRIKANTFTGAIRKAPGSWRKTDSYCDLIRYDSTTGCTCCFLQEWDEGNHDKFTVEDI